MPVRIKCQCEAVLALHERYIGRKARCPECRFEFIVPNSHGDQVINLGVDNAFGGSAPTPGMTVEVGAVGGTGQGMDFSEFEKLLGKADGAEDEDDEIPALPHDLGGNEKPKGEIGGQNAAELAPEKTASEIIVEQAFGTPESEYKRLKQFLARDKKAPHLWSQLGDVCLSLGRKQEALEAYDSAMGLDKSYDYLENKIEELLTPIEYTRRVQDGLQQQEDNAAEEERVKAAADQKAAEEALQVEETLPDELAFENSAPAEGSDLAIGTPEEKEEESGGLAIFDPTANMGFAGKELPGGADEDDLTLESAMEQMTVVQERKRLEAEAASGQVSAQPANAPALDPIAPAPSTANATPSPLIAAPTEPSVNVPPAAPGIVPPPAATPVYNPTVKGFTPNDFMTYAVQSGGRFTLLVCALITSGLSNATSRLFNDEKAVEKSVELVERMRNAGGEATQEQVQAISSQTQLVGVAAAAVMLMFFGYLLAYHLKIIVDSSKGHRSIPPWPSLDQWWTEILRPILSLMFHFLVAIIIPARILILFFPDNMEIEIPPPVIRSVIVATIGFIYLPMTALLVSTAPGVAAINPIRVVVGLFQTLRYYMFAMFFFALGILSIAGNVFLAQELPIFGFPLDVPLWMVTFYMTFTLARVLGRLYSVSKHVLDWEDDV